MPSTSGLSGVSSIPCQVGAKTTPAVGQNDQQGAFGSFLMKEGQEEKKGDGGRPYKYDGKKGRVKSRVGPRCFRCLKFGHKVDRCFSAPARSVTLDGDDDVVRCPNCGVYIIRGLRHSCAH